MVLDLEGVEDSGELRVELDVDNGTDNLRDLSNDTLGVLDAAAGPLDRGGVEAAGGRDSRDAAVQGLESGSARRFTHGPSKVASCSCSTPPRCPKKNPGSVQTSNVTRIRQYLCHLTRQRLSPSRCEQPWWRRQKPRCGHSA